MDEGELTVRCIQKNGAQKQMACHCASDSGFSDWNLRKKAQNLILSFVFPRDMKFAIENAL